MPDQTPSVAEPHQASFGRFLIGMNDALSQEGQGRAIIVYMGKSFVPQLHLLLNTTFEGTRGVCCTMGPVEPDPNPEN